MRLRSDFALYLMTAFLASCDVAPHTYEIGDELVLEITPPKFSTIVDNTACEQWLTAIERGDLQAFPPKTDTVIVQEGSVEVSVKPVTFNRDGTVKTAAKVTLRNIPPVTRRISYQAHEPRSGGISTGDITRCKPIRRRVVSSPATFVIRDKTGATIKRFETAEAAAEYINSK